MKVYHASNTEFDQFDVSKCNGRSNGSLVLNGVNVNPDINVAQYYVNKGADFLYECEMSDSIKLLDWEEGASESPLPPEDLIRIWYGWGIHAALVDAICSEGADRSDFDVSLVATQLLLGDIDWIAENELSLSNVEFDYDDWFYKNNKDVNHLDVSTQDDFGRLLVRDAQHRFGKVEGLNWLYDNFDISGISHINRANGVETDSKTSVLWNVTGLKIIECINVLEDTHSFDM